MGEIDTAAERRLKHEADCATWRTLPAPMAVELRSVAKRLREIAKAIFQSGKWNTPFVKGECATIAPLVIGWFTRAVGWDDKEQRRLFETICSLLGRLGAGQAVESAIERLTSLAGDVDALAATLDPQPVTFEIVDEQKIATEGVTKPMAPKTEGAISQGVFVYNGKRVENIPPAPWRLLEFMEGRIEGDTEEAYRYAIKDHAKESTSQAIKSLLTKANAALEEVTYPKHLSKVRGLEKLIWA